MSKAVRYEVPWQTPRPRARQLRCSRMVTHPCTNRGGRCSTSLAETNAVTACATPPTNGHRPRRPFNGGAGGVPSSGVASHRALR
jgi:hypothetical protein